MVIQVRTGACSLPFEGRNAHKAPKKGQCRPAVRITVGQGSHFRRTVGYGHGDQCIIRSPTPLRHQRMRLARYLSRSRRRGRHRRRTEPVDATQALRRGTEVPALFRRIRPEPSGQVGSHRDDHRGTPEESTGAHSAKASDRTSGHAHGHSRIDRVLSRPTHRIECTHPFGRTPTAPGLPRRRTCRHGHRETHSGPARESATAGIGTSRSRSARPGSAIFAWADLTPPHPRRFVLVRRAGTGGRGHARGQGADSAEAFL